MNDSEQPDVYDLNPNTDLVASDSEPMANADPDLEWITVAQAARLLGIDRSTINRWIKFNCRVCKESLKYMDGVGWVHKDGSKERVRPMSGAEAAQFKLEHDRDPSDQEKIVKDHLVEPVQAGNVVAKRTGDGWIIRADTLPQYPRLRRPHVGVRLEVTQEVVELRTKVVDLASQVTYWRGQCDAVQKLLPEARESIERRERELEASHRQITELLTEKTLTESQKADLESRLKDIERAKEEAVEKLYELKEKNAVNEALMKENLVRLKDLEHAHAETLKKTAELEAQKKLAESKTSRFRWMSFAAAAIILVATVIFLNVKGVFSSTKSVRQEMVAPTLPTTQPQPSQQTDTATSQPVEQPAQ